MYQIPSAVNELINQISRLPSIGQRTASRLVFHLLKENNGLKLELEKALSDFNHGFSYCVDCHSLINTREELCSVCKDAKRDQAIVCVVEDQLDMLALEEAGGYQGLYHVLGGEIDPRAGTAPQDLNIASLVTRVKKHPEIKEVIIATNPTVLGEATSEYLLSLLKGRKIKISRIAHGLPFGGDVEYADKDTLIQALKGRRDLQNDQ